MATIVNNQPPERVVAVDTSDNTAGWAVAVIILIAVIGGLFWWYWHYRTTATPSSTNINVTVPLGTSGSQSGGTTP